MPANGFEMSVTDRYEFWFLQTRCMNLWTQYEVRFPKPACTFFMQMHSMHGQAVQTLLLGTSSFAFHSHS